MCHTTPRAPAHLRVACLRTAGKIRALWLLISSGLGFASPRWPCLSGVWVRSGRRLARVSISNETSRTAKLTNREILESTSRAVSIDLFDDFKRPKSELCGKKKKQTARKKPPQLVCCVGYDVLVGLFFFCWDPYEPPSLQKERHRRRTNLYECLSALYQPGAEDLEHKNNHER